MGSQFVNHLLNKVLVAGIEDHLHVGQCYKDSTSVTKYTMHNGSVEKHLFVERHPLNSSSIISRLKRQLPNLG